MLMRQCLKKLNSMTDKEIDNWEKELNFKSVTRAQHEVFDIIKANLDKKFTSLNISETNFVKMFKNGAIDDVPKVAKKIIKEYGLQIVTNSDGTKELKSKENSSVNYRFLNKNYMFAIGGDIHIFNNSSEFFTKNWNITTENNLKRKKDVVLRNKLVDISDLASNAEDFRKISGRLHASRSIYWSDVELDSWSVVQLYFTFDSRIKHHWWWGYDQAAISGSGRYKMASNYRGYADPFIDYSDGIVNTTTQSPYFLRQWWQFDGDFPWIAFKDTWVHFNFADSNDSKWEIKLNQRTGSNVNPVYFYNLKSATYNRHEYFSPGDIH